MRKKRQRACAAVTSQPCGLLAVVRVGTRGGVSTRLGVLRVRVSIWQSEGRPIDFGQRSHLCLTTSPGACPWRVKG